VAGFFEHGNETSGSLKKAGYFLTGWVTIGFSSNVLHHGIIKYRSCPCLCVYMTVGFVQFLT